MEFLTHLLNAKIGTEVYKAVGYAAKGSVCPETMLRTEKENKIEPTVDDHRFIHSNLRHQFLHVRFPFSLFMYLFMFSQKKRYRKIV